MQYTEDGTKPSNEVNVHASGEGVSLTAEARSGLDSQDALVSKSVSARHSSLS